MKIRTIYTSLFLGIASLSLSSCLVAKKYKQPQVLPDQLQYRTDHLPTDSMTMAEVQWKDFFTDVLLQQYIEKALENNIDIRIAIQQIADAEAYYKQGRLGYLPTLNAGISASLQKASENTKFGAVFDGLISQFDMSLSLSWEFDIWGKIRSQKRAAEANYLSSVAAHQAVKTRLVATIATTYYRLLAIDKQIGITENTIVNRSNGLQTITALKESGAVTEVAVKQTEAQLYTAQSILIDLQKEAKLLENTLSILLGEMPHHIERTHFEDQKIETELKTGVPLQLVSNRPDVRVAENGYRNAFEMVNVARSQFYPTIRLTASGGIQSFDLRDLFDVKSLFANLLGGLLQPIFNQRQIRTQYQVAIAQQNQARLRFEQSLLVASREVSDALYAYDASTEKLIYDTKKFDAYNQAVVYSEALLNHGLANYLEVLTAKDNALNAELYMVNTKLMQLTSIVDLYRALGGGWK